MVVCKNVPRRLSPIPVAGGLIDVAHPKTFTQRTFHGLFHIKIHKKNTHPQQYLEMDELSIGGRFFFFFFFLF